MPAIPEFSQAELESICSVLADTGRGLTGTEIGSILARLGIPDPMPTMTKRHRLFEALAEHQVQSRSGNVVGAFIQEAMNPVQYTGNRVLFDSRRDALNSILAFCGTPWVKMESCACVPNRHVHSLRLKRLRGAFARSCPAEGYIPMC
jgi:hypothetical protein